MCNYCGDELSPVGQLGLLDYCTFPQPQGGCSELERSRCCTRFFDGHGHNQTKISVLCSFIIKYKSHT